MAKQKIKVIREEMLQVANNVAQEKSIDQDSVFEAMEMALEKAARVKYGFERDIRVSINRDSGDIKLNSYLEVVEKLSEEEQAKQITLDEAKKIQPNITTGEFIIKELPPIDMGRVAAQNAKGVIIQKVREADKSRQFSEYKDKVGEIAVGVVKRTEFGNLIVDLGKNEAIIKREELIPRETFQNGDRVRAYIYDVKEDIKGYQIFLSRTHPQFLSNLFTQEVPEIYENVIQIKSVARDPGSRAKISVYTEDSTIDPVGACVGMRGSRVQAVVNELQGEKIDIVMWSDNQATFLANALAPAEVSKIFLYEEKNKVEVVIPDEQLSLAIGRKGQNVKLASNLTNLEIDILTEEEESDRRQEEFKDKTKMLIKNLDVEDVIAQLLVTEGYVSVEGIASESLENLEKIEGFDRDLADELISRASNYLREQNAEHVKIIDEKIQDDELKKLVGMNNKMLSLLAQNNIVTIDDFADLASFELIDKEEGIFKDLDIDENVVNNMIMKAREKWFTEAPAEEVTKAESTFQYIYEGEHIEIDFIETKDSVIIVENDAARRVEDIFTKNPELIEYSVEYNKSILFKSDQDFSEFFENSGKIIIFLVCIYFIMISWDIDVTAWVASAGILSVVIGFAAKDTLGNLFAGIFIMADSPYKEGDYINLDTGDRGYVTNIGIRSTRIQTRDGIEITIPNSVIATTKIINESGGPSETERIRINVEVSYGSKLEDAKQIMNDIVERRFLSCVCLLF